MLFRSHFIDVGQANATLLEFKCGVVLIDAGAQDDEHVDGLVDFITSVFDARPELDSTLEAVYVTHNHIDHNPSAPGRAVAGRVAGVESAKPRLRAGEVEGECG